MTDEYLVIVQALFGLALTFLGTLKEVRYDLQQSSDTVCACFYYFNNTSIWSGLITLAFAVWLHLCFKVWGDGILRRRLGEILFCASIVFVFIALYWTARTCSNSLPSCYSNGEYCRPSYYTIWYQDKVKKLNVTILIVLIMQGLTHVYFLVSLCRQGKIKVYYEQHASGFSIDITTMPETFYTPRDPVNRRVIWPKPHNA